MKKPDSSSKGFHNLFFVSSQFWICNLAAWCVFAMVQASRYSFDASPLGTNLIKILPTALLGFLVGLCVHFFYSKWHWHKRHPILLIPIAGLIALIFAVINISVNLFDLVISIPEICSRQYPRPPYSCGAVSDLFLQSLGIMLVWCLFYFLIQAERKNYQFLKLTRFDVLKAAITLLLLNYLGSPLSVIAYVEWGDTHYLFSRKYFSEALVGLPFSIIFASYILFIKPRTYCWGSKILPLVPTIIIMSLCFSILSLGVESAFFRFYNTQIRTDLPIFNFVYYVFFGSSYGNFGTPGILAGVLQGSFTTNLLAVLFFLSYSHSNQLQNKENYDFHKIDINNSLTFWICNFLFWSLLGSLIYATDLMDLAPLATSVPFTNAISFTLIGLFIGSVLRLQMEYFIENKDTEIALAIKIFVASLLMGILLTSSMWMSSYAYIFVKSNGLELENYKNFVNYGNYVFASILVSCILCGLWAFICYMIESQKLQRNSIINQLNIEKNLKEVQLNALAGKVDPHFVFNALNNIRALVDEDKEKARSAIVVLSDILRSPITNNLQSKIALADEMSLVRNYIALSKIQYEDLLNYHEFINDDSLHALIPAMILQILVENAIKHGISQLPDGGTLSLHIHRHEQQLICKIINDGTLEVNPNTSGFGIGTKAVRERLELLYHDKASFSLQEINNRVIAELVLPFENSL